MSDNDDIILPDTVTILNYLWNTYEVVLLENEVSFKFSSGAGHPEFYVYGPTHIAVCIYEIGLLIEDRLELLVIKVPSSTSVIRTAVIEMLNMIKRKRIGPITRRIKA